MFQSSSPFVLVLDVAAGADHSSIVSCFQISKDGVYLFTMPSFWWQPDRDDTIWCELLTRSLLKRKWENRPRCLNVNSRKSNTCTITIKEGGMNKGLQQTSLEIWASRIASASCQLTIESVFATTLYKVREESLNKTGRDQCWQAQYPRGKTDPEHAKASPSAAVRCLISRTIHSHFPNPSSEEGPTPAPPPCDPQLRLFARIEFRMGNFQTSHQSCSLNLAQSCVFHPGGAVA